MIVKTNQPEIAQFCQNLKIDCELLIDDNPEVDQTPFIFVKGASVEKMAELTKSPKTRMILNMLL
jgi:hypothetical protein